MINMFDGVRFDDYGINRKEAVSRAGIRVIVYEAPGRPVALRAAFAAGRRYDPAGLECLAHVVEHMIIAGTSDYPTEDKLVMAIERLGGMMGAQTSFDAMRVWMKVGLASDFTHAASLLDQMINHSRLDQSALPNELSAVRQELAASKSGPAQASARLFLDHVYRNSRLQGLLIDREEAIDAVTIEDVRQYVDQKLASNRMVLTVVGGITLSEAIASLNGAFTGIQSHIESKIESIAVDIPAERVLVRPFHNANQVNVVYGFAALPLGHVDVPAEMLLARMIGNGRTGSLARILRYESGLVYTVVAHDVQYAGYGHLSISTACTAANVKVVIELINNELSRLAASGPTDEELRFVKESYIKSRPVVMQDVNDWAVKYCDAELYGRGLISSLPSEVNTVAKITVADIKRVAQNIFRPGHSVLVMCGDTPAYSDQIGLY